MCLSSLVLMYWKSALVLGVRLLYSVFLGFFVSFFGVYLAFFFGGGGGCCLWGDCGFFIIFSFGLGFSWGQEGG